jgi:hypothetical protein
MARRQGAAGRRGPEQAVDCAASPCPSAGLRHSTTLQQEPTSQAAISSKRATSTRPRSASWRCGSPAAAGTPAAERPRGRQEKHQIQPEHIPSSSSGPRRPACLSFDWGAPRKSAKQATPTTFSITKALSGRSLQLTSKGQTVAGPIRQRLRVTRTDTASPQLLEHRFFFRDLRMAQVEVPQGGEALKWVSSLTCAFVKSSLCRAVRPWSG